MTAAAQFVERYSANVPMGRMGQDSKEVKGAHFSSLPLCHRAQSRRRRWADRVLGLG